MQTLAQVTVDHDPHERLAALHDLEDEDVRSGIYTAFDGTSELLHGLQAGTWALVTSNYEHRVRGRFLRTGLPVPSAIVGTAAVGEGNPLPPSNCEPPSSSAPIRALAWSSKALRPECTPA